MSMKCLSALASCLHSPPGVVVETLGADAYEIDVCDFPCGAKVCATNFSFDVVWCEEDHRLFEKSENRFRFLATKEATHHRPDLGPCKGGEIVTIRRKRLW
jgi:hypothetical protein